MKSIKFNFNKKNLYLLKKIGMGFFVLTLIIFFSSILDLLTPILPQPLKEKMGQGTVKAISQYTPTSGSLVVGAEVAASLTNIRSYKGAAGNDGRYWSVTRANVGSGDSLDMQFNFDGVMQYGANKIIITTEAGQASATAYRWQICDWVSSTDVDAVADANCTGGGWRTLNMRKVNFTNTTDTTTTYEIFDGYFYNISGVSPGILNDTPIANFIKSDATKRVLIRANSTATGVTTQINVDEVRIELAIDPIYEVNSFTKINSYTGATTNYVTNLTGIGASDSNKFIFTNDATNPMDFYVSFKNVERYTGMNTIVVKPEICVSTTALTFNVWLYNFSSTSWEQIGSTTTGTACNTDTAYAFAKTLSNLDDYISSNEVRVRFSTAVANTNTFQIDRLYMIMGSTNTTTADCEISMGTGTSSNCSNTTTVADAEGGATANTSTWDITSALEYPNTRWALDDDNATDSEYGKAANLSFPITVDPGMAVTAVHWANRFRPSNAVSTETIALNLRDFGSVGNTAGGWSSTIGTTNNTTNYTWSDSWQSAELQTNPEDYIDTVNNKAMIRMRTSASTNVTAGTPGNWDFAMASIRWIEETNRITLTSQYTPTSGSLVVGAEVAASLTNIRSYKGAAGNDGRYWSVTRANVGSGDSLDMQFNIDGVMQYGANKIIITTETGQNSGVAYRWQICDWVSSTDVDAVADANCTGGGWRTLNMRKVNFTNTTDTTTTYEIFDGYFYNISGVSPGILNDTPIANFIKSDATKRVLIRANSTATGVTAQINVDEVRIELAIDPIYEVNSFTKINSYTGATTNYVTNLTGIGASDNNKFTFTNDATNPMDFYVSFKNVERYTGMNTIVVKPEICTSTNALTFNVWIYNFSSTSWEQIGSTTTGSACANDVAYAFAKTLSNLDDYISSNEVRVRFSTAVANTNTFQIDRLYMIMGSTNTTTADCEISMGTGTASNCSNTTTVADAEGGTTANTSTWDITSALEYPDTRWALDDDNATDGRYDKAANLSFPITVDPGMAVTAVHWANRFRPASIGTTETIGINLRDFGSVGNTTGGWSGSLGATTQSANYLWTDSWQSAETQTNPEDYIDTVNNKAMIRMRTVTSTNTTGGTLGNWDFAMASIRWVEKVVFSSSIDVRAQDYTTSVSTITFPSSSPGSTVSAPYNNVDGSGSPQVFGGAGNAKPVITLYNGGSSSLMIWYNITTFTNNIVSDEYYLINNKGAACADASCITNSVVFDANTETGTIISAGANNEKDFYLKINLTNVAAKSGNSTLTILGETP